MPIENGNALAANLQDRPRLRAFRNFQRVLGLQCRNLNFGSQSRLSKRNRHYTVEVIPPALEKRMFLDVKNNVEIAVRTAVDASFAESGKSNPSFVLHSRRNFRVNGLLLNYPALAFTLGTRIADHAPRALARRTRSGNAEETLLITHLTAPSATPATCGRFALCTA